MQDEPGSQAPAGNDDNDVPRWMREAGAWIVTLHPYHRALFIGLNVVLTVINIYGGAPWWAVWPLLVTGLIYTIHYLLYAALTVDDAWVEERAAELYDKSYDQGHIDSIASRYEMETAADRRDEAARAAYEEEIRQEQRRRAAQARRKSDGNGPGKTQDD